MDRTPFHGRILLQGCDAVTQATRSLLLAHLDMPPERVLLREGEDLQPGDLLVDLLGQPPRLARCRERGVLYLSATRPARAGSSPFARCASPLAALAGPTAVLGHAACPGLTAHLGRIALRDLTAKTLPRSSDDPGAAELAKLLRAADAQALARVSGVRKVRPIASANRDQGWAVLGVLVSVSPTRGAPGWWTGSFLDDAEASRHVPGCDAATLQTAVGLLSAALWMLQNPRRGIRTPEQLPHEEILDVALPYLGQCVSRAVNLPARP